MDLSSKTQPTAAGGRQAIPYLLVWLFLVLFVLLAYTFLHESGHALACLALGGKITDFSVNFWDLSAHVGYQGDFSPGQQALISAAGVTLPVLAWLAFMFLAQVNAAASLQWLKFALSLIVLSSLLAWVFIPLAYLAGQRPSDDSVSFLAITGAPPLLVSLGVLAVIVSGWAIFLRRSGGIPGIRSLFRERDALFEQRSLRALGVMVVLAVLLGAAALGFGAAARQAGPLHVPEGYSQVAEISLAERPYSDETVYTLALQQASAVQLYFVLEKVKSGPLEIAVEPPGGERQVLFAAGGDFSTGLSTINPDALVLPAGKTLVRLTSAQTKGIVTVYTLVK